LVEVLINKVIFMTYISYFRNVALYCCAES